ncbi:MAG: permease [Syntrophobacteraceae bacterium]
MSDARIAEKELLGDHAVETNEEIEPSRIDWKTIWMPMLLIVGAFLLCFYLPLESKRFTNAVIESLALVKWYAQEHMLLCLVPALFIAGAISCFVSQAAVMRYLGPTANKTLAYGVSAVSGSILAVCSCTVLPLFAGIWKRGAGLGPAIAFLYSGPAINILAIVLTARILGMPLGIARAVGAISFSIVIGLIMHFVFIKEEEQKAQAAIHLPPVEVERPLWQNIVYFGTMVGILISATWAKPSDPVGFWNDVFQIKWWLTGAFAVGLAVELIKWFRVKVVKVAVAGVIVAALAFAFPHEPLVAFGAGIVALTLLITTTRGDAEDWFLSTWGFTKQITPLLLGGVLAAGLLLGQPNTEGIIPSEWVKQLVGGNSLGANLFSAVVAAFMYFATLTEVPILQGLISSGMGNGPALALLLAGPALSLPSMLVIRSVMGTKKTIVYVSLVVIMSTICGMIFGHFYPD